MKIFKENLYFITTGAENFCEIIAYRSNKGQINIGENVLDLLGVDSEERGFLIRNLFLGGDDPIIITSDNGALIFNRQMLYSTGICCVVQPENPAEAVCCAYHNGHIGRAIMSPKAKCMAKAADENDVAKAYLDVSRIERTLEVFGDKQFADGDIERIATLVCDCIGCKIEGAGEPVAYHSFSSMGMIYANSIYATAVLLMAFLAKMISDDRILVLRQSQGNVSLCINGDLISADTTKVTEYVLYIAQQRDIAIRLNVESGISLDICPFFLDIGLTGVKNPAKLKQE